MVRLLPGAVVLVLAVAVLVTAPVPATAHTRAATASQYDSRITAVPDVAGVQWRTYAGGDMVEVTVAADVEVTVLGYEGEPYLRVTPAGVFTNANSPATYLNADRYADVALPPRADASLPAEWQPVSGTPVHAWHDHRIHWMSPTAPPMVRTAPHTDHLVQRWAVEVHVDGQPHELAGELWWVPGGPVVPWLAAGLLLTAPAALGVTRSRRRWRATAAASRLDIIRGMVRPAAVTVVAVAGVNLIHFVDEFAAWPAPALDIIFGVLHTALFVGTGLVGAAVAWRATQGPFLSLGIASGAVLFHQGLLQWAMLPASQLPTVWPENLPRLAVALSVSQAGWVALVLVIGMRAAARKGQPGRCSAPAPAVAAVTDAPNGPPIAGPSAPAHNTRDVTVVSTAPSRGGGT